MKRTPNRHSVVIFLMALWMFSFAKVVRAATLSEFMGQYDSQLLQWAAATALLGGMIRTILSLESDTRVIKDILKTALNDAFKALVAGLFMFLGVQMLRSVGYAIPSEVRFTAVLVAGWQRMAIVFWIGNGLKEIVESLKTKYINAPPKEIP
jgi:hypothetical protein